MVDLTSDTQRLASRLQEAHLKCTKDQRDYLLYYILVRPPSPTTFLPALPRTAVAFCTCHLPPAVLPMLDTLHGTGALVHYSSASCT